MTDIVERIRDYCREFGLGKSHVAWKCADEIERLRSLLDAANAYGAGENSVRIEEREQLAQMMIRQSLSTGHGDTVGDLVRELEPQIKRMRAESVTLRNAAVNADECAERLRAEVAALMSLATDTQLDVDKLREKLAAAVLAHIDTTAQRDRLRELLRECRDDVLGARNLSRNPHYYDEQLRKIDAALGGEKKDEA